MKTGGGDKRKNDDVGEMGATLLSVPTVTSKKRLSIQLPDGPNLQFDADDGSKGSPELATRSSSFPRQSNPNPEPLDTTSPSSRARLQSASLPHVGAKIFPGGGAKGLASWIRNTRADLNKGGLLFTSQDSSDNLLASLPSSSSDEDDDSLGGSSHNYWDPSWVEDKNEEENRRAWTKHHEEKVAAWEEKRKARKSKEKEDMSVWSKKFEERFQQKLKEFAEHEESKGKKKSKEEKSRESPRGKAVREHSGKKKGKERVKNASVEEKDDEKEEWERHGKNKKDKLWKDRRFKGEGTLDGAEAIAEVRVAAQEEDDEDDKSEGKVLRRSKSDQHILLEFIAGLNASYSAELGGKDGKKAKEMDKAVSKEASTKGSTLEDFQQRRSKLVGSVERQRKTSFTHAVAEPPLMAHSSSAPRLGDAAHPIRRKSVSHEDD